MTDTARTPTMRIEFCTSCGYDEPAIKLADHIFQTRPKDVPGGILLSPSPPGVFAEFKVIWQGEVIYAKTPEEVRFPEHSTIDALIDERAQ